MNECIICQHTSISFVCEDCQADFDIDVGDIDAIPEMGDMTFGRKLHEGFALLDADENPEEYDDIWS